MYEYRCTILKVVDGDTVDVRVDLGFSVRMDMKIRLLGINAPEMNTPEGKEARAYLIGMIGTDTALILQTVKDRKEKYGRYLGTLWLGTENPAEAMSLNLRMYGSGHATSYP